MTLDAEDLRTVTELAMRVTAEAIRNVQRGTGGSARLVPVLRTATVLGGANAGAEVTARADGEAEGVPAINATGLVLEAGDRVLVTWDPGGGVYMTELLSRSARGSWTPTWSGPSADSTDVTAVGWYTRTAATVLAHGLLTHGASSSVGTGPLVIGGLPFPVRSDGDSLPVHGHGWLREAGGGTRWPLGWVIEEGQSSGDLYCHAAYPTFVFFNAVSTTTPFTWGDGDDIYVQVEYETDA